MSKSESSQVAIDQTRDFLMSPEALVPNTIESGRHILFCIHPSAEQLAEHETLPVVIGSPGGKIGEGVVHTVALSSYKDPADRTHVAEGIQHNQDNSPYTQMYGHYGCAYVLNIQEVTAEMIDPSDFTRDQAERWHRVFGIDNGHQTQKRVRDGLLAVQEDLIEMGVEDLEEAAGPDSLKHTEVPVNPGFYFLNRLPHLGLNRHKVLKELGLGVQAYNDSLGAALLDVQLNRGLDRYQTEVRRNARTLLSASAACLLGYQQDKELLEAVQTREGPAVMPMLYSS
jgi:hypothetical protein